MSSKSTRKDLTLKEKIDLIKASDNLSQRKLAEKFGCGKTSVGSILKRKAEYLDQWEANANQDRR